MSYIPVDNTHLTLMVQNDSQKLREVLHWVADRRQAYGQNVTSDVMTALGVSSADQNFINSLAAEFVRIDDLGNGTVPSSADNMRYVIAGNIGVM